MADLEIKKKKNVYSKWLTQSVVSELNAFIGFSFFMSLGGIIWGVLCILDGLYFASIIPFSYTAVILPLTILCAKKEKLIRGFSTVQFFMSLLLPFLLQLALGGWKSSGGVMLWSLSALLGSFLIFESKKSMKWLAFFLILCVVSIIVENTYFVSFPDEFRPTINFTVLATINFTCVSCMIYFVVWIFVENLKYQNEVLEIQKQDLKAAKENAEAASDIKYDFLANLSHNFKTPLHAILSFSDIGKNRVKESSPEELEDFFDEIEISAKKLSDLVDGLMDISAHERKRMNYIFSTNNFLEIIEDSKQQFNFIMNRKGVNISVSCSPEFKVSCDRPRLVQVMSNLISNAIKFCHPNSEIKITVTKKEKSFIAIRVSNLGQEISNAEKVSIFNEFNQGIKLKNKKSGSGLGLSLCKKIIEHHGGGIWVEAENELTEFVFTLPSVA